MKSPEEMAQVAFSRREEYKNEQVEKEERWERFCRRASAITMAVLCVAMLGIGGVLAATLDLGDLFRSIFSIQQGSPISENQATYIEEHMADIGESVTADGYTVTVKGALTDGTTAHILVDVIGPEGIDLETISPGFDLTMKGLCYEDQHGVGSVGATFWHLDDNDGKANTISMNIEYNVYGMPGGNFTLADGRNRTLHLADIWYNEAEYPYTMRHVAEGPWVFNFAFTALENKEVELLQAPIFGSYSQISGNQVDAIIHSVMMKGLSATVYYTLDPGEVQEAGDFGALKFVMKDGTELFAYPDKAGQTAHISNGSLVPNSGCHYCTYVFLAPINYQDVDTVYIGDTPIKINHQ